MFTLAANRKQSPVTATLLPVGLSHVHLQNDFCLRMKPFYDICDAIGGRDNRSYCGDALIMYSFPRRAASIAGQLAEDIWKSRTATGIFAFSVKGKSRCFK